MPESQHEQVSEAPPPRLCDFLRDNQDALISDWTARIRALPPANGLSTPVLVDHFPRILARIADTIEAEHSGAEVPLVEAPRLHAVDRLARGFDLEEVIKEYVTLRRCILALWERSVGPSITVAELRRLDDALDQSIIESTTSFARARERLLRAVNRISEAGLGSSKLDGFLERLLQAALETAEIVDTAAVMLREGDVLRMRATVGVEDELAEGFTTKIGEGFAGKVAAEEQPITLRDASTDPLVQSEVMRRRKVHALYGVPLSHDGRVIGVAYMGSRAAYEFSEEDKLLFRTTSIRATSVIVQAQLIDDLQLAAAERGRMLMKLVGQRARLEQVLNQLPTGVIIASAPAGEIEFANKRCRQMLGTPEVTGWKPFHLDGRPYALEETPRHRALRGLEVEDELKIQRPDGGWVVVHAHAAPLRDQAGRIESAIVAFDDISAQKRSEDTLRFLADASRRLAGSMDYETTLAEIARLAVPGMCDWFTVDLLDADGEVRPVVVAHVDPKKTELAKDYRRRFPPDPKAPGGGLSGVLHGGPAVLYEDVTDELLAKAARNGEQLKAMHELGIRSTMVVPLKAGGATVGAITFLDGDSGRRFRPADLEAAQGFADRAATAIENARLFRAAERAVRLREDLLAVVSHDLRNPVAAINLAAALLVKRAPDARTRKQLDTILRSTWRMDRLIGDLLDMASIRAGRLAVERSAQPIAPVVAEAVELARPQAMENEQTVTSEIATADLECLLDRDRVLQLFSNLLGNAMKFCPRGGAITVRARRSAPGEVECSVSDTGPGISEHDLPHLFEPYWSAKREAKNGIGLGLYISKGIVEAHGGRIWAERREGQGATLCFTLPIVGGQEGA